MVKGPDGKRRPACRQCRRESVRRVRERQKPQDPFQPVYSPRLKSMPPESTLPIARQVTVFNRLPHELQALVYGVVAGARLDPLTLSVIRRASEAKVWSGTTAHHATGLFIGEIVSLTLDSRRPDQRPDVILARLFSQAEE
jgi:hypothetical protein